MTTIPEDFTYLEPWEDETSDRFADELYKEISSEHMLFGVQVKTQEDAIGMMFCFL